MKAQAFKSLIKEAVKEAIQEELREILLEAVKAPKQTIVESVQPISFSPPQTSFTPQIASEDRRARYSDILGETAEQFTTQNVEQFNPQGSMPGGDLPGGELGMNQIMGLLNTK